MRSNIVRLCVICCLVLLIAPIPAFSQVMVILSRHAEKASSPPKDPGLSNAGEQRANLLASMLADAGVDEIFVTEYARTQQTAAPLAARDHLKPVVVPANDTGALIKTIRELKSGVVLVVGHSNTVPAVIAGLGGPTVEIPETQYDNLFVLTVGASHSSLLRLHYGSSAPVLPSGGKMEPMMPGGPKK